MIPHQRLLELLRYEPDSGLWIWLQNRRGGGGVHAGDIAGRLCGDGYWQVYVEGHCYQAHRLAVFYMTGLWPIGQIDHDDLDKSNNRWVNIRPATPSQQRGNTRLPKANTSGLKWVTWNRKSKKWQACVRHKYLGVFDCPYAAHERALSEAINYYGDEFARAA